jgi:fibronectin-binding autotransporter adhesin
MNPEIQYRHFTRRTDLLAIAVAATGLSTLAMPSARAADYSWNATSGTWDTTTANWTGGGAVWVDDAANNPTFANTTTPSTITLAVDRNAGAIKSGNATNNYNFTFTGSGVTLTGATFALQGPGSNDSQDAAGSHTVFNGSLNLNLGSGNVTIGRANLEFGGSGAYTVGSITTNADWGVFRMSGTAQVTATNINLLHAGGQTGGFDLNGGTLVTGQVRAVGTGTAGAGGVWSIRNTINGATLKPSQSNTAFLQVNASSIGAINGTDAGNNVWLGNNGAIFDTNGHDIGTATSFRDDTAATGTLVKSGAGTLTLSGASTYTGATAVNGGTLRVNGSLAAGSAVAVNGSAALGGTGTVNGPVTLAAGSTAGTQGTISLVDGGIGTLSLSNAAGLGLGGTAGNLSKLAFDVSASSADQLSLGANALTVGAGGASISVTATGVTAGNTYDLITFGSGTGDGYAMGSGTTVGALTLATPNLTFGVSGSLNVTDTAVQLVTSGASAPTTAYWSGVQGASWNSTSGANGNFTTNANGTGFVGAYPNELTDVIFAANGNGAPANLTNTLGQDFNVFSLTFAGGTGATQISGANQLGIDAGGINLQSGNGGATLAMSTLALASTQVWTNASENDLTVSAVVTGSSGLTIVNTGSGSTILSGANTYTGGTFLQSGSLRMSGSGALGATTESLTIDAGAFDLNGTSQSVGNFSGTGGMVVNDASATAATLTIGTGNANGGDFQGVIADHTTGTGTVALTKAGNGTLALSGANTYSGKTTVSGGTLLVGTGENLPNASVVEINNGGKLNIQAFTETIGGLSSTAGDTNVVQNVENTGTGDGTLVIDTAGGDFTFTGIVRNNFGGTSTLAFVKNGAGTQTLKSTTGFNGPGTFNDFTGGITINGGTLLFSDSGNGKVITATASAVSITSAAANLALENTLAADTETLGTVISGSGNVVVTAANAGTVALSQANTYTGDTTVSGGTLSLAQPYLADGSTVFIASGAVLHLEHGGVDQVGSLFLGGVEQGDGLYDSSTPGGFITGTGKILVGELGGFSAWAAANAPGQTAEQDHDNDGMPNGVEYFMGLSGSSFTANPPVINGKVTWSKDPAFVGTYTVQTSTNLSIWDDVASLLVGNNIEFTLPTGEPRAFVRLKVTPN